MRNNNQRGIPLDHGNYVKTLLNDIIRSQAIPRCQPKIVSRAYNSMCFSISIVPFVETRVDLPVEELQNCKTI